MTQLRRSIETYIEAKDGNRPHLMVDAFEQDAELRMRIKTDAIAFPAATHGIKAIATVLVSDFGSRYENVYTFCLGAPPTSNDAFKCHWLVLMTEKGSGLVRAGFGQYAWQCAGQNGIVSSLEITIEEMASLPSAHAESVLQWARCLPYPWCPAERLTVHTPDIAAIEAIVGALSA